MALTFKTNIIELGRVSKGAPISFSITGTSTYPTPITLVSRGSCGCTSLKDVVASPNTEFTIEGTITARTALGDSSKYVYVKKKGDDKVLETTIRINYTTV